MLFHAPVAPPRSRDEMLLRRVCELLSDQYLHTVRTSYYPRDPLPHFQRNEANIANSLGRTHLQEKENMDAVRFNSHTKAFFLLYPLWPGFIKNLHFVETDQDDFFVRGKISKLPKNKKLHSLLHLALHAASLLH